MSISSNGEDFLNFGDDDHFDNTDDGGLSMDINDSMIGNSSTATILPNIPNEATDIRFVYDYDGYYYFQNDTQYYVLVAVGLTSCFLSICGSCIILYLILLNKYQRYRQQKQQQQQQQQQKQKQQKQRQKERLQSVLCLLKVLFLRGRQSVQVQQQQQLQEDGDQQERIEGQHQRQQQRQQSSRDELKQEHAQQPHAQPQPAQQSLTSQPSQPTASSKQQQVTGSSSLKRTRRRTRIRSQHTTTITTKSNTSNKNELLYHRLVMGLSFSDCIVSISLFLQAFFFPSTAQFPLTITNSSSTTSTTSGCNTILGFIYPFFISSYCYNCTLGVYFMLMVKYNWKQQQISRIMEPYIHILAFGVPLIYSSVCTYYKLFHMNPYLGICSPIPYPINCTYWDDMECYNNSQRAIPIVMIHDGISLVYVVTGLICTSIVYCTIRKRRKIRLRKEQQKQQQQQQQKTQEQQSPPDTQQCDDVDDDVEEQEEEEDSFQRRRRKKQQLLELQLQQQRQKQREYYQHSIGIQAIYYACAYMIGFVCFVIVEILKGIFAPKIKKYGIRVLGEEPSYYVATLLIWTFFPIQGFLNCIIFIRPRYQKWIQYYYLHEDTIRRRNSCGNAKQQLDDEGDEEGLRPYLSSSSCSSCRCRCSFSYASIWAFRMVLSGMPVPKPNDYSSSSVSKNKVIKDNHHLRRKSRGASRNSNHGASPSREDFSSNNNSNNNNNESHNSKAAALSSFPSSSSFSEGPVNYAAYDGVDDDLDMRMGGNSPILGDSMLLYDSILLGGSGSGSGGGGEHEGEETERNFDSSSDDYYCGHIGDDNDNKHSDKCDARGDDDDYNNIDTHHARRRQIIPESTSDDDDDDVETYEPLKT